MSISFSGLASGLDTSSWVESLVALKKSKVSSLETEKASLQYTKDAVSEIKTYFSAFRTSLEKVTDARLEAASTDLFAQYTASTSNPEVYTAVASVDAEEGSYQIAVQQLATCTTAYSDYSYTNTYDDTVMATGTSTLSSIGVSIGNSAKIGVTVNGIERELTLKDSDTIDSFVSKLRDIGAVVSFNENTATLSMNLDMSDINDIDGTGIVDALNLAKVNEGYQSAAWQIEHTDTISTIATTATKLCELGTGQSVSGTVNVINSSGEESSFSVNNNTTIAQFIGELQSRGLYANLTSEGILEISGGIVTGDSNFNPASFFGLQESTANSTAVGNALSTTILVPNKVELSTRFVEDLGVSKGYFAITNSGGDTYYDKIYSGMTIADLMTDLGNLGINATLDVANGVMSISGGTFTTLSDSEVVSLCNSNNITETDVNARKGTNLLSLLNGNVNSSWDFKDIYNANDIQIPSAITGSITRDTRLADIIIDGSSGITEYQTGYITVMKNGVQTSIMLNEDDTVGSFLDGLKMYGFNSIINDNGQIIISNPSNASLTEYTGSDAASNILEIIGANADDWVFSNVYESTTQNVITTDTYNINATENTKLSEIASNFAGILEVYVDNERNLVSVSENETVGSLLDKFRGLGLQADITDGKVTIQSGFKQMQIKPKGAEGSLTTSNLANSSHNLFLTFMNGETDLGNFLASNSAIKSVISVTEDKTLSVSNDASLDTEFSMLNISDGSLTIYHDGQKAVFRIGKTYDSNGNVTDDVRTLGDLLDRIQAKFSDVDFKHKEADGSLLNGYLTVYSTTGAQIEVGATTDTSNFVSITGIAKNALGLAESARELYCVNNESVVTSDGLFRRGTVTEGTFTVGDQEFTIDSNTTLADIVSQINYSEKSFATAYWDNVKGELVIQSKNSGTAYVNIEAGTSNFTDIMGFTTGTEWNANITGQNLSAQASLNTDVLIDIDTTINDVLSMLSDATHSARIDVAGNTTKFIVRDLSKNADMVIANIENASSDVKSGTAKFSTILDAVLGKNSYSNESDYLSSKTSKLTVEASRMSVSTQQLGNNAKFTINGTSYTSTSNEINSDVSRIKGVTINLNGTSEGESSTLTVGRDTEVISSAIQDVVDAYNVLMENVDEAIARGGSLASESSLKMIRNQLRSLMTSSVTGSTVFKNLDAIGISVAAATGTNVSTSNEAIVALNFDSDKFAKAFNSDNSALKSLLVGTGANWGKGVFDQLEEIVEKSLEGGYFTSAEKSYSDQIRKINEKITKANKSVETYKSQLEAKFKTMDMLISKMNQQYSSFLS